jgi:hypothetical protein
MDIKEYFAFLKDFVNRSVQKTRRNVHSVTRSSSFSVQNKWSRFKFCTVDQKVPLQSLQSSFIACNFCTDLIVFDESSVRLIIGCPYRNYRQIHTDFKETEKSVRIVQNINPCTDRLKVQLFCEEFREKVQIFFF